MQKMSSTEKAIEVIQAGQRIFVHGAAATPHALLAALFLQAERLTNTELIHLHSVAQPDDRVNLEREWSIVISKAKHGEFL